MRRNPWAAVLVFFVVAWAAAFARHKVTGKSTCDDGGEVARMVLGCK